MICMAQVRATLLCWQRAAVDDNRDVLYHCIQQLSLLLYFRPPPLPPTADLTRAWAEKLALEAAREAEATAAAAASQMLLGIAIE